MPNRHHAGHDPYGKLRFERALGHAIHDELDVELQKKGFLDDLRLAPESAIREIRSHIAERRAVYQSPPKAVPIDFMSREASGEIRRACLGLELWKQIRSDPDVVELHVVRLKGERLKRAPTVEEAKRFFTEKVMPTANAISGLREFRESLTLQTRALADEARAAGITDGDEIEEVVRGAIDHAEYEKRLARATGMDFWITVERLSTKFAVSRDYVFHTVLSDLPLSVPAAWAKLERVREPDLPPYVTIHADLDATPEQVAEAFRSARRAKGAERRKPISAKSVWLGFFTHYFRRELSPGLLEWHRLMRAWNTDPCVAFLPQWQYTDASQFKRDALLAETRLYEADTSYRESDAELRYADAALGSAMFLDAFRTRVKEQA